MLPIHQRKLINVTAFGTADGKFDHKVDIPHNAKYCIVKQVVYDFAHDLINVRVPFVEGGVLCSCVGGPNSGITPNLVHKIVAGSLSSVYTFETVNSAGVLKDLTFTSAGEISIWLEFA